MKTTVDVHSSARRRRMVCVSVSVAAVLGAGCGSSARTILPGSAAAVTTNTTSIATTTTRSAGTPSAPTGSAIERQLGAVVRGLFATRDQAAAGPIVDPDSPLLATYAAGNALDELRAAIRERRDQGLGRRPSLARLSTIRLSDAIASTSSATAAFCQVDDDMLYRIATGEVVDNSVVTRAGTVDFEKIDGAWKVVHAETTDAWDGVAGCALRTSDAVE